MIGIRADANNIIATGHVMRCITIAGELKKRGKEVIFFTADNDSDSLIDNAGFRHVSLLSDWKNMESELEVLAEQIKVWGISALLVDSYQVTYDYFKALSRICPTAYIDDLDECTYPVDLLINYSGYYDRFDYVNDYSNTYGYKNEKTKLLLGLNYAPLRPQFYEIEGKKNSSDYRYNILLAAGGGDIHEIMLGVLTGADNRKVLKNVTWNVVIGNYVSSEEKIRAFERTHTNVVVHKAVSNMAKLMSECGLAVTAAGTMLTECAAMRLPAVFYMMADNQRFGVEYWQQGEKMLYAGDVSKDRQATVEKILDYTEELIQDPDRVKRMSENISLVTDGKGSGRIAEALISL